MTITGNTFFSENIATTVDINPAVGFSHSAMSTTSIAPYMNIDFNNNVVKGKTGASPGAANWDTWEGAVRFWHPDAVSWFQAASAVANNFAELAGGFHIHQDYLRYFWNVKDNTLTEIYFLITDQRDGGAVVSAVGATEIQSELFRVSSMGTAPLLGCRASSLWTGNSLCVGTGSMNPYTNTTDLFGLNYGAAARFSIGFDPSAQTMAALPNVGGQPVKGVVTGVPPAPSGILDAMQEKVHNTFGLILSATLTTENLRVWVADGSQIGP